MPGEERNGGEELSLCFGFESVEKKGSLVIGHQRRSMESKLLDLGSFLGLLEGVR